MALTIFMFHRVLPRAFAGALSTAEFERSLDYLERRYRMLPAAEVEDFITGARSYRGDYAALSFDDGYVDNLLFASPVLERRGLSALLAVSAGPLHDGAVRGSESDAVLFRDIAAIRAALSSGDRANFLTRDELRSMQESGLWRLELHGTRHELGSAGFSVLSTPQNGMDEAAFRKFLAADLEQAHRELSELTGRLHRMLFWPWGHYSRVASAVALECGLDIQFTVIKGSIRNGDERVVLPRIGVSPRYRKFVRNCFVFRHPVLAALHDLCGRARVDIDRRLKRGGA